MKAITLTQPWASLVAIGAKRIETRSWKTSFRGPIAIHAAKGFPDAAKRFCESQMVRRALGWCDSSVEIASTLPTGCVIATAELVNVLPTEVVNGSTVFAVSIEQVSDQERAFGDYGPGRFAWFLENVKMLDEPVPARGMLSLWEWDRQ